jgi:hypothetical protein
MTEETINIIITTPSQKCECCRDVIVPFNLISCSRNNEMEHKHYICNECFTSYIEECIGSKKNANNCVYRNTYNCKGVYERETILSHSPKILKGQCEHLLDIFEIRELSEVLYNCQICPFCEAYACEIDNKVKEIYCNKCNKSWCPKCRKKSHGKTECGYVSDSSDNTVIKNIVHETLSESLVHHCPNCETKYVKDSECNLITCTCGTHSCYICGMVILPKGENNEILHWHFKGSGSAEEDSVCLLYNDDNERTQDRGNTKYNNDKTILNCEHLLNINDDDDIRRIMINEMKYFGVKIDGNKYNIKEEYGKLKEFDEFDNLYKGNINTKQNCMKKCCTIS